MSAPNAPPTDGDSEGADDRSSSRLMTRAATAIAATAAVWFVADPRITHHRSPGYDPDRALEHAALDRRLNDGYLQRQWVLGALILTAVVLACAAIWRTPLLRRRIANGLGVGAVCGLALAALGASIAPDFPPDDPVSNQVLAAIGLALAAAIVATVLTRRAPVGAAPAMSPTTALRATITARLGAVVAVLALIAAIVFLDSHRTCGGSTSAAADWAAGVGLFGGIGAFVLGAITTILRRWFVGLMVLAAGGAAFFLTLIGALSCLE